MTLFWLLFIIVLCFKPGRRLVSKAFSVGFTIFLSLFIAAVLYGLITAAVS